MRCAPPELSVSKRLELHEDATRALETGDGLIEVIGKLENGKPSNEVNANTRISGTEESHFGESESPEIETIIRQTTELREGLMGLARRLRQPSAGLDRSNIADHLTMLHHRLSDLRAHVDIARREVALAKRVGWNGLKFPATNGFVRALQPRRMDR